MCNLDNIDQFDKSIINSLLDEQVVYDEKLSKLYSAYNQYPMLLDNRRQAIHFAFKVIFMYNVDDKMKIDNKSPMLEDKDKYLEKKKQLKYKIQKHDDKKEVMSSDAYKEALDY